MPTLATPTTGRSISKGSKHKKGRTDKALTAHERIQRMIGLAPMPHGKTNIAGIRAASKLSQDEFARLAGYSTRAVAGWEAGKPLAQAARRRFRELSRLLLALSELMSAGQVGNWLSEPNEAFDGQTPAQVVERGEVDRLWQMIHQIDANVAN